MSPLYDVLFANECTSTHHRLALDALRHLRGQDSQPWAELFLQHFDSYLDGAKAPDKKFKDFRNHVLHVRTNYWGGAVQAAEKWYATTVEQLSARRWREAIYSAGVLSHYYTDPIQPFHTDQSEAESNIHRAAEWSMTKSYEVFQHILEDELGGYPEVELPGGGDWLAQMVRQGAELANPYYEMLVDHYDLEKGVKDPPSGLDQESKDCLAILIGHAAVGFSRILERAFEDAQVRPPRVNNSLCAYLAQLTIPIAWVVRKMVDENSRRVVKSMYAEIQKTGKALKTMPVGDRVVRELHAEQVLQVRLSELNAQPAGPTGTRHGQGAPSRECPPKEPQPQVLASASIGRSKTETEPPSSPERRSLRFYLRLASAVEDAPSIGPRTASRLEKVGILTVADLIEGDPEIIADRLDRHYINGGIVRQWQEQARLVCCIPQIRGHDAQILVGVGVTDTDRLASMAADDLIALVDGFMETKAGERILRGGRPPDRDEVTSWIQWAGQSRQLKAA